MKRLPIATIVLLFAARIASAQSLDDLNIQIHGYATQGFLYTTQNNTFTTNSSDGSPAWTEAVVNLTSQPSEKLRIAVQARYFLLGNYGNAITLDYAMADYKVNDRFGIRFGKVKTPSGLFNETSDIDPAYLWSLLPQSIYPITSRNSFLSHYGGVAYGTLTLPPKIGKLEYRAWGGERSISSDDGYFLAEREQGAVLPNGTATAIAGAALHWKTPLPGFMIGASINHDALGTDAATETIPGYGTFNGTVTTSAAYEPQFFAVYEKTRLTLAGEYTRSPTTAVLQIPYLPSQVVTVDYRSWYGMASYKVTPKLTAGVYDSQIFNRQTALGPARFSKDWVLSTRYDFNQFLYAKAEQHFIDGTAQDFDTDLNPGGLKPSTKLTILKVGVSF